MLLFQTKDEQKYASQPAVIYVQEDSPTSITCKTIASLPATELSWTVVGGRKIVLNKSKHVNNSSSFDNSLFDTESTIMIHPDTKTHGMSIQCNASMDKELVGTKTVELIVYALPDDVRITIEPAVYNGMETNVTCKAVNGYPAPVIHWYIGSRNVTGHSSMKISVNSADRYDAESTLTFTPNRFDHGKYILCQAVQPTLILNLSMNGSMILNISFIPHPQSWIIVDENETTSSTLFVDFQPIFKTRL
ncbi:synaptogenesis protein syg-2-like [Lytechinus variegatus]|uniref:synaptogenesis protein syg-2-like n=1 Tax=Lytechinus variegatus TaxID=7654 RepID=UPI001BB10216|nr:synaptogenesis protein syg-2-like [Lytechinus variegatus]